MSPIRLHLDTSDYAAMYRALPASPEAQVRNELITMVGSGLIDIGLSYHVFFELLQKADPKFRGDRLARAQLLKQLCGKNALPYPTDLGQGFSFSHDGIWVPRTDLAEIEIERLVQILIKTVLERNDLSSHERKSLSKRKSFAEWIRNNAEKSQSLLEDHWPLPFAGSFVQSGNLRRYILSEIGQEEANEELRFFITDPVAAYETWFEVYGRGNPVSKRRDQIAQKLEVMLNDFKEKTVETTEIKRQIKQAIKARGENAPNAEQCEKFIEIGREIATLHSEISSLENMSKHPAWVVQFGHEGAQIAAEIFHGLYNQSRNIKPSDSIDLVHAMYLPHVDLWRGDKDFSNLLLQNRVKFHERVVPTLSELLGRIENEINKQVRV